MAQRCSRADLIHYPYHYLPATWTIGSAPKIVTVHGASAFSQALWEPERGELIKRGLKSGAHTLVQVITVSEWSKGELVEHFDLKPEQVAVIPNGVEVDRFRPLDCRAEAADWVQAAFGARGPYILHVGPCEPRKNMLKRVQAFARLKERHRIPHQLVLAGSPGRLSEDVHREVHQLGIADDVVFAGSVNDSALLRLYNGADMFFFPSLYEGFGIPVLEAMACGVPVVTSNGSALSEIAGNAAALVDDPTSVEELCSVCEKVLRDAEYRGTLRRRGLTRASEYTWTACATAHLKLYRQLAKSS